MSKLQTVKIGILGGSFDPAHKGHVIISKIALKKIGLKKIYWIITKKNPFKTKAFFSLKERIKLAKKITKKIKNIEVMYLDGILKSSRSIKVIQYILKKRKPKDLYFIVGSDILIKFHKWHSWKRIVKLTKLVVFSRKGYDKKSKKTVVVKYLNKNNITFIKNNPIQISSSILKKNHNK
tara:strand:+ start:2383 stop:2919 length:537 start_codon:yes stop_codon:yes gene_type:complete